MGHRSVSRMLCSMVLMIASSWGARQQTPSVGGERTGGKSSGQGGAGHGGASGAGGAAGVGGGSGGTSWSLNFAARPSEPDTRSEPTTPTADANCGTAGRKTVRMPVDVLLVLDRSNSMNDNVGQELCYCDLASAGGARPTWCAPTPRTARRGGTPSGTP
jgi:hypothetical protein